MLFQVTVFPVNRHEIFRSDQPMDEFKLLLPGMPGHVNLQQVFIYDICALFKQIVNDTGYILFIPGYRAGRYNNQIPLFNAHLAVTVRSNP